MKAVHFGAGNIGRGFIGLQLIRSGYELTFVDVNETLVSLLASQGLYRVRLAGAQEDSVTVSGFAVQNGSDIEQVGALIAEADIVTTAVGVGVLRHIAPAVARGIELRVERRPGVPLHVIACENTIGGSAQLQELVYSRLSPQLAADTAAWIAFPNAAVDRIVPLRQEGSEQLAVTVEPFFEWIVDGSQMLPGYAPLDGVTYVERLAPYIERKLFTVNTGHCCAAYVGAARGHATIGEAMADPVVEAAVRGALEETGTLLVRKYGFEFEAHAAYVNTMIERFRNPYLRDDVERVGRSPLRKLAPQDRFAAPALQLLELGIEPCGLALAMAAALRFDNPGDEEAVALQTVLRERGAGAAITLATGLGADHPLHVLVMTRYGQLGRCLTKGGAIR